MAASRDTLDQIKSRLDALEIIREVVPSLKQSGARWKGNCPFHNEKTPSFFYMPDKGLWHCFGACNEGGDVFRFVMRAQNLSFPEALRDLARRAGVPLSWERGDDAGSKRAKENEALLSLLDEAARFYAEALKKETDAAPARSHLVSRSIRDETVDRFGLGYAPFRNGFLDRSLEKGVPIERLLKVGLASRSERTGRYHDPLSGRLIFPIRDPYGQVVAFGGRVLGEDGHGPKYLNSPESPVYTKGRCLYGLFEGRTALRERGQAVVVEGYMDVVGLHQAGVPVAVAPLGTALTTEQARVLRRYIQEAVLLFDPDPAGQRASWRSAEIFVKEDLFVRVASVPGGLDPDEFVLASGTEALEGLIKSAADVVDFWLDLLAPTLTDFSDLHGRLRKAESLLTFLAGVPNALWRDAWMKRVAERLRLDPGALRTELAKKAAKAGPVSPVSPPPPVKKVATKPRPVRSVEEEMIQLLSAHPALCATVPLDETFFGDERCRRVFRVWREDAARGVSPTPGAALMALPESDVAWVTALLMEPKTFEKPEESLAQGVTRLAFLSHRRERNLLEPEVLQMLDGGAPRDEQKIARYQILTRELRSLAQRTTDR